MATDWMETFPLFDGAPPPECVEDEAAGEAVETVFEGLDSRPLDPCLVDVTLGPGGRGGAAVEGGGGGGALIVGGGGGGGMIGNGGGDT